MSRMKAPRLVYHEDPAEAYGGGPGGFARWEEPSKRVTSEREKHRLVGGVGFPTWWSKRWTTGPYPGALTTHEVWQVNVTWPPYAGNPARTATRHFCYGFFAHHPWICLED